MAATRKGAVGCMDMTLQVTSAARNGKGQQLMDMTGERRIPAPRQKVWEALNDTATLKACIPGCDSLEKIGESDLKATAALKIGPISAKFAGKVTLSDIDPPNGYTITGEGQGGVAGFAKGGANVKLADDGDGTLLTYDVKAQVGGKIAQLGARLIDATAKQMSDQFFDRFTAALTPQLEAAGAEVPAPLLAVGPREMFGIPVVGWVGIVIFLFILALLVRGFFL
jgi:carbon monoxide dehydrogenase subunit G